MLYTSDLMTDMEYKGGVQIKYLNFKFNSESYEEIVRNAKVYLQEIDATEFAVNDNGVKQFFDLGELVAEGRYAIDLLEVYGEDQALAIEIQDPFPFTYGKTLLVTLVFVWDHRREGNRHSGVEEGEGSADERQGEAVRTV